MKIIEQSYEILSIPDDLLATIERCGRVCYKSEDKIGCTLPECMVPEERRKFKWSIASNGGMSKKQNCTGCPNHSSHKFTKMLLDRGHHAMIEFGDIIVRFVTNRGVTHELVRHRLCSFAQESTRYVRYDGSMEFIRPVWWKESTPRQQNEWTNAMDAAEVYYLALLKNGWRPEQAREVLPHSLKTEIITKGNIREWRHMFDLRCSKKAHPQIRHLMMPLLAELKQRVPVVFDDLYPEGD